MLHKLITEAQNGDKNAYETLIDKFTPIINKYSRLVYCEDAQQDFYLFFLELLQKIPTKMLSQKNEGKIVNYISIALKNHYHYLVKQQIIEKNVYPISSFLPETQTDIANTLFCMDEYTIEMLDYLQKILTKNELEIIILHVILQYSIQEISCFKAISRQAVNQTYRRAIDKIANFLLQNGIV